MSRNPDKSDDLCGGCVYHPPNLPAQAYREEDWLMLQAKSCSFDLDAGNDKCLQTRRTSCSIINLETS